VGNKEYWAAVWLGCSRLYFRLFVGCAVTTLLLILFVVVGLSLQENGWAEKWPCLLAALMPALPTLDSLKMSRMYWGLYKDEMASPD
jgi:hypothetical protein